MQHDIVSDSHREERRRREGDGQSEVDISESPTYFSMSLHGKLLEGKSGGAKPSLSFVVWRYVLFLLYC
jgi:hypothetical protein